MFFNDLNDTHKIKLTHCKLNNQYCIRFVVGSPLTGKATIII